MRSKFVVGLDKVQSDQPFTDYIKAKDCAWWHWIPGFWIVIDYSGELDCARLRDDLNLIYPDARKMVIEIPGGEGSGSWAGFGPRSEQQNMFTWFEENW